MNNEISLDWRGLIINCQNHTVSEIYDKWFILPSYLLSQKHCIQVVFSDIPQVQSEKALLNIIHFLSERNAYLHARAICALPFLQGVICPNLGSKKGETRNTDLLGIYAKN